MGRALKKRKLKKTRRVKIPKAGVTEKKSKKSMKNWEWWLFGAAFVFVIIWLIFLGKSGNMTRDAEAPTPMAAATQTVNQ